MKHNRYSLKRDRETQEMSLLQGDPVTTPEPLREAFKRSMFYYQFHGDDHVSRIMRCSSPDELAWLAGQVSEYSPVVIQRG